MKIEEGKFYKTRDGRKVGPMIPQKPGVYDDEWKWTCEHEFKGNQSKVWEDSGNYDAGGRANPGDIVSEWSTSPVVTKTVTEIVPGTYGIVRLSGVIHSTKELNLSIDGEWHSFSAVTDAIATLTAIRDALQEQDT